VARTTMIFGVVLIALGLVGYVGTGAVSMTALIPSAFGVLLALLGWLALHERYRKHAMHVAAAIGVVGFLGSVGGLMRLPDLFAGAEVERPAAVASQSVMAIVMVAFVSFCVRSFIDARRARRRKDQ
jgi:membrane-bound ClpP family serine protease